MNIDKQIEVMKHFKDGGLVELSRSNEDKWSDISSPAWNWDRFDYRAKVYDCPMYFELIDTITNKGLVVRFDSIKKAEVLVGRDNYSVGHISKDWIPHTNTAVWKQVDKPLEIITINLEKWLCKYRHTDRYEVIEGNEDLFKHHNSKLEKIELLSSQTLVKEITNAK